LHGVTKRQFRLIGGKGLFEHGQALSRGGDGPFELLLLVGVTEPLGLRGRQGGLRPT
jgi:hypothetical protein